MPHEFRDDALDKRQFLALVPVLHLGRRLGLYRHFRWTRGAEAALNQRHHLPLLHRPPQHLTDGFAFAQHIDFKTDRHFRLDRSYESDRQ
ncbi:hypothetical protein D3C85_1351420 [compost metagenome]